MRIAGNLKSIYLMDVDRFPSEGNEKLQFGIYSQSN